MKKQFILICSLFLILSVTGVCASDDFNLDDSSFDGDIPSNSILALQNDDCLAANESVSISAPNVTKYCGGSERFQVSLSDGDNNTLSNKSVLISINGVDYARTTNSQGSTSLALRLNPGEYPVTVSCGDTVVNSNVVVLSTINASDIVKMDKNATQYYATFLDGSGKYLADGTTIRFNINGVFYDRKVRDGEGLAKLNINLNPGQYVITAMNLETGDSISNMITVLPKLIENSDLTKYYKNATQYTLKVLDDEGNVVGAGETVTFNINGVLYNRMTNKDGISKMNINLNPGDYIITAQVNGSFVSNKIKVLPILSASDLIKYYGNSERFVATLVDGQGNICPNQSVSFNINGVIYNRTTDKNGQARLNINLLPSEYIITSMFNGSAIANNVIVKPVMVSVYDIINAAYELNSYYEKNHRFPDSVKVPFYGFTMPEFFYMMNKAISQIKSSNFSEIRIIEGVGGPDASGESTVSACLVKRDEFAGIADKLASQIAKDKKVPATVDTSMGKLKFNDYMVVSTRILSFYHDYNANLADYVTFVDDGAFKNFANPYGISGKNVYIDADGGSDDKKWDLARVLTAAGWNVKVGQTDSNSHYKDYFNTPANYVLINIYNGFCAGTIRELASSYIQNVLRSKNVVCVPVWDTINWTNPDGMGPYRYGDFSGYSAKRAWDDNFSITDPYISNVAQYLASNNIKYCSYPTTEGLAYQFLHGGAVQTMS
ncbi:hypothetical protein [Methanobrevibacter sp.]|uniref:hypothetical protein n=1 Tax=Methanobrevibacter sp. TaxID=66852 RepID=UPI00388EB1E8